MTIENVPGEWSPEYVVAPTRVQDLSGIEYELKCVMSFKSGELGAVSRGSDDTKEMRVLGNRLLVRLTNLKWRHAPLGEEPVEEWQELRVWYPNAAPVRRFILKAMKSVGMEFPRNRITEFGDVVSELESIVLDDGRVYETADTEVGAEDGRRHYVGDLVLLGGVWHLKSAVNYCPECRHHFLDGERCRCWVQCEDGQYILRKDAYKAEVYQDDGSFKSVWLSDWSKPKDRENCSYCGRWFPRHMLWRGVCEWHLYEEVSPGDSIRGDECAVITDYHDHYKDKWFRSVKDRPIKDDGWKMGMGFELEVDKCERSGNPMSVFNNIIANEVLSESGLDPEEVVFECDGSLESGFEIISQPHTINGFWCRQEKWAKMLDILAAAGFQSHTAGTCGLHVHVSRRLLGKTESEQDVAIGKIRKIYFQRWDDFVKASRRNKFNYCGRNSNYDRKDRRLTAKDGARRWKQAANKGGHYDAINDGSRRRGTVEFRLGRGTLNKDSFFAWIDLCLTIAKNSRKSEGTLRNHAEWLKGLRESSARYLCNRGAFVAELKELFPQIGWAIAEGDHV